MWVEIINKKLNFVPYGTTASIKMNYSTNMVSLREISKQVYKNLLHFLISILPISFTNPE